MSTMEPTRRPDAARLRDIARRAVPFGLPTVDLHRILVDYALNPDSPEYKAPLNHVFHTRRLSDPSDRAVVNPNVDTPYSWAWLDLRSGPVVLTMPAHPADRYMSAELFDLYSYVLGYVSPRTAGNGGGRFLVHGPRNTDAVDDDFAGVFECPTALALVLVRTQLFDRTDLPAVAALQDGVRVDPVGPAPPPLASPVPTVDVRHDLDVGFLRSLDWMLSLAPVLPEDAQLRSELASIGCGTGDLDKTLADPDAVAALTDGLASGMKDVSARCASVTSSAQIFGSRAFFAGDYASKAAGAVLGILGNIAEEYLGVGYRLDADGQPFHGSNAYTISFTPADLPPVDAFWSITVYDAQQHLYDNSLDRYVLGSRQVPDMIRDDDGVVTIHVSHDDPGKHLRPNWLPCPPADFGITFRTYLPGAAIREGSWTAPPVRPVRS